MRKITVSPNEKFHKLTVIKMLGVRDGFSVASCRCDCGNFATIKVAELRSGHKRSCGCSSWRERSRKSSENIVGKKYGRLTVVSMAGADNRKYRLCNCVCDCGHKVKIRIARMLSGEMQSCGCLLDEKRLENLAKAQAVVTTHGLSQSPTGTNWNAMMQRCFNARAENFYRYGAVGIKPCAFLKASPVNLVVAIGTRPSPEMSIDRIDTTKGYFCGMCEECLTNGWPANIRWATPKQQANNRRPKGSVSLTGKYEIQTS